MTTPLEKWVEEQAQLAKPEKIHWCDGSLEEAKMLMEIGLREEEICGHKTFSELNQQKYPGGFYHRSNPNDVARTEQLTFICHDDKMAVGPNNNWMAPAEAKEKMAKLSDGCMKGRTMYVMPFMMGHPDSLYAKSCVQITDTVYVALNMRVMTRMGKFVKDKIGNSEDFIKGFHSIGDLDANKRFIMHFPSENLVWSIGSGYGGNALLGKKCIALRIASWQGLHERWLAEHMVIMGVEDPEGRVTYVAAALPSACGKTNLAMMQPSLPGYKIWTVGDDIAWLNVGPDGQLWGINPENGFFGVAPGTSLKTNPNMVKSFTGDFFPTLFTNVAIDTDTNTPWWEGYTEKLPKNLIDWQGNKWDATSGQKAAHANSRFTVALSHCPTLSSEAGNPQGVPISAIIFGCRRANLIPLVMESFDWQHGVSLGARMGSETTAAGTGKTGQLRRDPMAMLPFCGYNMADYFAHWLKMESHLKKAPKIFSVNWFRTDEKGNYLWPGFGENIRPIKWILDRVHGHVDAAETPIGLVPKKSDFDLAGLNLPKENLEKLFHVDMSEWGEEVADIKKFMSQFGDRMPHGIKVELEKLEKAAR